MITNTKRSPRHGVFMGRAVLFTAVLADMSKVGLIGPPLPGLAWRRTFPRSMMQSTEPKLRVRCFGGLRVLVRACDVSDATSLQWCGPKTRILVDSRDHCPQGCPPSQKTLSENEERGRPRGIQKSLRFTQTRFGSAYQ
ncbi:Hypothetical protein CINCED_3A001206 [Cinara cedri]|uniref:Uncharacterized protein n=1 Tax=Cinara cedri TaxID=506608 RepID=A0A5E4M5I9_9HEMI|nr:Hypothetical protein CINCED_3A001206 [Cinara cedri]